MARKIFKDPKKEAQKRNFERQRVAAANTENKEEQSNVVKPPKRDGLQKTKLLWDQYWWALEKAFVLIGSTYRATDKHMATLKSKFEAHLTNRLLHQLNAANKMKEAAGRLYLNEQLAYHGMFGHDNGHPFSAHDGEVIFDMIGEIYDLCYFHHNEKSEEVIEADELLKIALLFIKNDENFKIRHTEKQQNEILKTLEEEFYYILDITISHDGEASPEELLKGPDTKYNEYTSIKEIVRDKEKRAKTKQGDYKFIAQTPEGMLGKYADVFAYLTTDVMDAYRLGIFKQFDNDYLEVYGAILVKGEERSPEEYRRIAKEKIAYYTELFTTNDSIGLKSEHPLMQETVKKAMERIEEEGLDVRYLTEKKFYDQKREDYEERLKVDPNNREELLDNFFKDIDENAPRTIDRIKQIVTEEGILLGNNPELNNMMPGEKDVFVDRTLSHIKAQIFSNSKTIIAVTSEVSEFFMNDLVKSSTNKNIPQLSPVVTKIYKKAKHWIYNHYLPEVKTVYQIELLPANTLKIVEHFAKKIMESGVIEKKLLDPNVREQIPSEMLECIKGQLDSALEGKDNKRNMPAKVTSRVNELFSSNKSLKKEEDNITSRIKDVVNKQGERFALTYQYLYIAIEDRIRNKVKKVLALSEREIYEKEHINETEKKQKKEKKKNGLDIELERELDRIKEVIEVEDLNLLSDFKSSNEGDYNSRIDAIVQKLVAKERKKMIEKMAIQIVCDYISGKTEPDIKNLAIELGIMTEEQYQDAQKRTGETTKEIQDLQNSHSDKQPGKENDKNDGKEH